MSGDKRVILECVFCTLYVNSGQRMRRVLKAKVDNILWCDAQEPRSRRAEEAIDMRSVPRSRFQCSINIREAVRVAIDKTIDRQIVLVGKETNEPPRRAGRHSAHFDNDAIGGFPKPMIVEALE